MTRLRLAAGMLAAAAGLALVVWASSAPLAVYPEDHGVVRLAWSLRPERLETCRERTPDELARLPQHMRQKTVCEGAAAEYDLTVRRNGEVVAQQRVQGGGWRHDRRLYVLHDIEVPRGASQIEVQFERVGGGAAANAGPLQPDQAPAHLSFSERLDLAAREVVLITYSQDRRVLVPVRARQP